MQTPLLPLVLKLNLYHGNPAHPRSVELRADEQYPHGYRGPFNSPDYCQLYRDDTLIEEQDGSEFYVTTPGAYCVIGIQDDGTTRATPFIPVTEGMIRDASNYSARQAIARRLPAPAPALPPPKESSATKEILSLIAVVAALILLVWLTWD